METIVGDYIGTTTGIHSPIPHYAPGSTEGVLESKLSFNYCRENPKTSLLASAPCFSSLNAAKEPLKEPLRGPGAFGHGSTASGKCLA